MKSLGRSMRIAIAVRVVKGEMNTFVHTFVPYSELSNGTCSISPRDFHLLEGNAHLMNL